MAQRYSAPQENGSENNTVGGGAGGVRVSLDEGWLDT